MFRFGLVFAVLAVSSVMAAPKPKPSYLLSGVAAGPSVVTAQSSQVVARNYHALAAPAPILAAAPIAASPIIAGPIAAGPVVPPQLYGPGPFVYAGGPAVVPGPGPYVY